MRYNKFFKRRIFWIKMDKEAKKDLMDILAGKNPEHSRRDDIKKIKECIRKEYFVFGSDVDEDFILYESDFQGNYLMDFNDSRDEFKFEKEDYQNS